ncbi:hypothetical protein [Streptomyces sp. DSM 15324]|nr:hypothetical protein [Streptomyces sp. DSM 15324]
MRIGFGDDYLQRLVMYVAFLLDARFAAHVVLGPAHGSRHSCGAGRHLR